MLQPFLEEDEVILIGDAWSPELSKWPKLPDMVVPRKSRGKKIVIQIMAFEYDNCIIDVIVISQNDPHVFCSYDKTINLCFVVMVLKKIMELLGFQDFSQLFSHAIFSHSGSSSMYVSQL